MLYNKYSLLFNQTYLKYCKQMWIHAGDKGDGFYSYLQSREVAVEPHAFINPDAWDLFALLHEIGHILTNTNKMKRCEQEYLATQWAIKEAKEIGFEVPPRYIETYQDYIWNWRDRAIKLKAKVVPSKEELKLCA